jgi:ribosomal protein L37AE/L43A
MNRPVRQRLLRWCTACRQTTSQVRLTKEHIWRCSRCGAELVEVQLHKSQTSHTSHEKEC